MRNGSRNGSLISRNPMALRLITCATYASAPGPLWPAGWPIAAQRTKLEVQAARPRYEPEEECPELHE
jgi:hypothetical protein